MEWKGLSYRVVALPSLVCSLSPSCPKHTAFSRQTGSGRAQIIVFVVNLVVLTPGMDWYVGDKLRGALKWRHPSPKPVATASQVCT